MSHQLALAHGDALDAHFDIEGTEAVFHARGGSRNSGGESNPDYGEGLRVLRAASVRLGSIFRTS